MSDLRTPKLVALDVDGTILGPGYQLHDRTRDALVAVRRAGVLVSIATGRPPNALNELVDRKSVV